MNHTQTNSLRPWSRLLLSMGWLLLVGMMVMGCQTTRVARPLPGLTRASLESEGMVVAAVIALGGGEYVAADALAERVAQRFQAARPWLRIAPLSEARLAMSQNRHADLMKKVGETNRWLEAHFKALAPLTNVARYALIVDVTRSREHRMVYRNYQEEYLHTGASASASPLSYDVISGGVRHVTMVFYLYDLRLGQTVWVASGSASQRAVVRQSGYENLYRPAPPAGIPSVVEVGEVIARRVAQKLPR